MSRLNGFKRYLSKEVEIEFKACMYFFVILFYICLYQLSNYRFDVSIMVLAEVIFATYVMGYIQVYFLENFDEAEHFGRKEALSTLLCTVLYCIISYLCNWFDRNVTVTVLFFFYIICAYFCLYLVYKIKRMINTKQLNENLAAFKARRNDDIEENDDIKKNDD